MERTHTQEVTPAGVQVNAAGGSGISAFLTIERFRRFAAFNLAYTIAVILWGAYVRATGSGAGCGDHWPLCNGEVIPRAERIQTVIEFTHRSSSGVNLIFVVAAFLFARKIAAPGSLLRRVSGLAVIAIFMEAILGAGLVLLKLVEFDQSASRAISISLHLVNTLFLVSTLTSTVFFSRRPEALRAESSSVALFPRNRFFLATLGVFVCLAIMGAIAALGDTLFPAQSILHGISQDMSEGAHFLVRLRVIHPILAVAWIMMVFGWSQKFETIDDMSVRSALLMTVIGQFVLGFANWMLMAPSWMQILHLLMAEVTFITFWWSGLRYETREATRG
ncbi:MAG: COX15/CtaA family protein [Bdellovibrionales bacterium]|nr:COX15/CtaA family protein [Bdellovibrionales bacterium]